MEENKINKFIDKIKFRLSKNKKTEDDFEYVFSSEEIQELNKENQKKISVLKQDILSKEKEEFSPKDILSNDDNCLEDKIEEELPLTNEETTEEIIPKEELKQEPKIKNSFINLSPELKDIVINKWNSIPNNEIEKDIIDGKDLLNHNYTITYADMASEYIHNIRKKYETVICYLIGFNNEKKGIFDKTIFSDKIDDEWRYLSQYLKLLEKIRNFKK